MYDYLCKVATLLTSPFYKFVYDSFNYTFKNEFIKLGIPAEDYDIQDEFGETDHIVDLYSEIRGGTTESRASLTI